MRKSRTGAGLEVSRAGLLGVGWFETVGFHGLEAGGQRVPGHTFLPYSCLFYLILAYRGGWSAVPAERRRKPLCGKGRLGDGGGGGGVMAWFTLDRPGIPWFWSRRQQPFSSLVVASSGGPVVSFCHHAEHRSTREGLGNGSEGNYGGEEGGGKQS